MSTEYFPQKLRNKYKKMDWKEVQVHRFLADALIQ